MDPEAKRVSRSTGTHQTNRDVPTAGGYWRRRGGRIDRLSPHRVFAVDVTDEGFQWARGGRFGRTFVVTESSWGSLTDDGTRSRFEEQIAGRTLHVSVPESLIIRRTFRLPTKDAREIETMLGYQLGPSLPVELRELQWSWRRIEGDDDATVVMVELCRRDALADHLARVAGDAATIERAVPEGWLLAARVREATGVDESAGLFLRPDGVLLVVQTGGALAFAARITRDAITPDDVDAPRRRAMQQRLERALEPARESFENASSRSLPPLTVIVDPAQSDRDRDVEVVVANVLGAQPAGIVAEEGAVPWRATALAAVTSVAGATLHETPGLRHRRRRSAIVHGLLFAAAVIVGLGITADAELRRLEQARDGLHARSAAAVAASADLATMQEAMRDASQQREGGREPLHALLAVHRHATSDFLIDRLTYLAHEKVEIAGTARDVASVIAFARKIEGEAPFVAAAVRTLAEVERDEATRVRFVLEAEVAP